MKQKRGKLAQGEAGRSFSLASGPLLRVTLVRLSESEHLALVTMHHIVSDGWSLGVLVKEVGALYEAYSQGDESPLAELRLQYADYAVWQRGWLQGEVLEQQLSYWLEQLAGAPVLELPVDHVRPAVQSYRGATQSLVVGKAGGIEGVEPPRRRDVVHDVAGRVSNVAIALERTGRHRGWDCDREPDAGRSGRTDRVFRKHAGAAHGPDGRSDVP